MEPLWSTIIYIFNGNLFLKNYKITTDYNSKITWSDIDNLITISSTAVISEEHFVKEQKVTVYCRIEVTRNLNSCCYIGACYIKARDSKLNFLQNVKLSG